jgi:hypothetical protein
MRDAPTGMYPVRIHGYGAVAQLVERVVRNDEVRGSIPLSSTNSPGSLQLNQHVGLAACPSGYGMFWVQP